MSQQLPTAFRSESVTEQSHMQLSYIARTVLAFSIFIAGTIGAVKFNRIRDVYRPFIYLIWIGCVAEVLGTYCAYVYRNNLAVGAIYRFCESLFLLWFFNGLGIFKNYSKVLYSLIGVFFIIWIGDNFMYSHLSTRYTYYFDMVYSFSIVLLSITAINDLLFTEKELLKNPVFLICSGLIIYFTYKIMDRMFGLFGLKNSADFKGSVTAILALINCFTNLIYAFAVAQMQKRQPLTFRF
jgi:hypothetical protein